MIFSVCRWLAKGSWDINVLVECFSLDRDNSSYSLLPFVLLPSSLLWFTIILNRASIFKRISSFPHFAHFFRWFKWCELRWTLYLIEELPVYLEAIYQPMSHSKITAIILLLWKTIFSLFQHGAWLLLFCKLFWAMPTHVKGAARGKLQGKPTTAPACPMQREKALLYSLKWLFHVDVY